MPSIAAYDHLNLSVREISRSAAWYTDVLGFRAARQVERPEFQRVILLHGSGQVAMGLTQHHGGSQHPFAELNTGMDHIAFSVPSVEDLGGWAARFAELGVEHSEIKQAPGGFLVTLRDPDNIQLEVRAEAP